MKIPLVSPATRRIAIWAWRTLVLLALMWAYAAMRDPNSTLRADAPRSWWAVAHDARSFAGHLLREYPETLDAVGRTEIEHATHEYNRAMQAAWLVGNTRIWLTPQQRDKSLKESDSLLQIAAQRLDAAFARLPDMVELSANMPMILNRTIALPFGSGVVLLHRIGPAVSTPEFVRKTVDLSSGTTLNVEVPNATAYFCALELINAQAGSRTHQIRLTSGSDLVATLDLTVSIPPRVPLKVEIRNEAGNPTEAAVGLYSTSHRFLTPSNALDFGSGGYAYAPVSYRDTSNAKYWPGGEGFTRCFFLKGGFEMDLPPGSYRLIATKGPEYLPVDRTFQLEVGKTQVEKLELRRWIDMSGRGWHSGDCHIHYARSSEAANQRLLLWTQAEDLRMGNILRMGDARLTYFEQYAFGKPGRFLHDRGALVPGQEDPRTGLMGHTISLNLQAPIRDAARYYLYSHIFDEAHRQGALSGYAHVNNDNFLVHRDMTINVPRGKADFAEICEFGEVGTELLYEFLNLGFRLTVVGGSDVPWGRTVGDSRVYAFTGTPFDPDLWFDAVRKGRTFVTTGPMLEFTVDGRLPGEQIKPARGQKLKVSAHLQVGSSRVPLGRLEVIANGHVIGTSDPVGRSAHLDLVVTADKSMWIAARTIGAHSTPVYVVVDGKRHWNTLEAANLLEKRIRTLDEMEKIIAKNGAAVNQARRDPEWENVQAFRLGSNELRGMIAEARAVYDRLHLELVEETKGRD